METTSEKMKSIGAVIILWLMMQWEDIKDIAKTVIVTFVVCTVVTTWFFKPVVVSGRSMHPTIKDGSIGFSSVISKNLHGIDRFDIVIVRLDRKNEDLIKRVVGLPGETVVFENDRLYIDGKEYSQDFLDKNYVAGYSVFTNDFEVKLADNEYFCMGDNRPVSADSRMYGPFTRDKIEACGLFVIYPFNEFGAKD